MDKLERIFSYPFAVLVAVAVVFGALTLYHIAAVRRSEREIPADDLKTFDRLYRDGANRADMPPVFGPLAQTIVRARRAFITGSAAVILAIAFVIIVGPQP